MGLAWLPFHHPAMLMSILHQAAGGNRTCLCRLQGNALPTAAAQFYGCGWHGARRDASPRRRSSCMASSLWYNSGYGVRCSQALATGADFDQASFRLKRCHYSTPIWGARQGKRANHPIFSRAGPWNSSVGLPLLPLRYAVGLADCAAPCHQRAAACKGTACQRRANDQLYWYCYLFCW